MAMETTRFRFSTLKRLLIGISALLLLTPFVQAQEVPYGKSIPISSRDRVYTADQISNTVSVIDPSNNQLLGVIRLGDPITAVLSPLYKGQLLVHGLGFSPDHRTLAVISIGSNSVTLIDTATNKVKGTLYIGRSPHEGFFTPNGKELWVVVRGEDYISVIDPVRMKEVRRIQVANGPGMVLFRPDARYAFVPSSFTPELNVIDVKSYKVIAKVKQASPFSPNLAVSPDGSEVWFTLKDVGKAQIISAKPPFTTLATLDTGPITNHVNFVDNANGHFAYVTVGGLNEVKVYRRGTPPELVATIPVGNLPHGIWPSGDGRRIYVGLENGDAVQVIDTLTNQTIATIPVGQLPQALVYVPDAVPSGGGTSNLVSLKEIGQAHQVKMGPPSGQGNAQASVVINSLGQVDQLQIAASGLEPEQEYQLYMVDTPNPPYGNRIPLARFKANPAGTAIAQTIGPIRGVASQPGVTQSAPYYLLLTSAGNDQPVLVEPIR
jgi:YVTN family beta-propeller protein